MANTISIHEWLRFVDDEYLSTFVKDGGASIKFAVTPDGQKTDLYEAVKSRCQDSDYVFVELDAAKIEMRAHMPQDIFFGLASQIDWRLLARRLVLSLAADNGYRVENIDPSGAGNLIDVIAHASGLDPSFVRLTMNRAIQNSVYRNQKMSRDFRVCMSQLCLMSGESATPGPYADQPLLDWLTGVNKLIGGVKPFAIRTSINRTTARYFIESALYWVRYVGHTGTVILLDNSRVTLTRRPKPPDGKRYYTRAMTMEHYELLREFIDGVDRLAGALLVVVTNQDFLDDSADRGSRGYGIYQALRTRIMDDVRDRNLVNPVASLVRLSQGEEEVPW